MSQKILLIICCFVLALSCKKDPKKTTIDYDTSITEKEAITKAYQFFSTTKELEILYKSDAWRMMLNDANKIGLQNTQVAKLDSTYFIQYSLKKDTKSAIFDQRMEALPSFKNFREMSKSLTGNPLDYHEELTELFSLDRDSTANNTQKSMILYFNARENEGKVFPSTLFQEPDVVNFEKYLKSNAISQLDIYQQKDHLYAVVKSAESTRLETLYDNLYWNTAFDNKALSHAKQTNPKFEPNALVFKNWKKMVILR